MGRPGCVIARTWISAMSRTSATEKLMFAICAAPAVSRVSMGISEAEMSLLKVGPKVAVGLMTLSSV